MSKHTKALKSRLADIEFELGTHIKDKKRDRLKAERDEIREELGAAKGPSVVEEVLEQAGKAIGEAADHEAAEAGKRHLAHLKRVGELEAGSARMLAIIADPETKKKKRVAAEAQLQEACAELEEYREATRARTLGVAHETTGRNLKSIAERSAETDEEIKARVLAKRAAREGFEDAIERRNGQTEQEAGVIHIEDEPVTIKKGKKLDALVEQIEETVSEIAKAKTASQTIADMVAVADDPDEVLIAAKKAGIDVKDEDLPPIVPVERVTLVDPEAVQPRDRWGRPIIITPDGKEKGYRRMTTFIDVIDDKDNLVKWKGRVILAGVAATEQKIAGDGDLLTIDEVGTESIIERVEVANQALEKAVKSAKKQIRKAGLSPSEYQDLLDAAEKAHRNALNDLSEEAFQAGDGYLKAETGTRIHKLTEFVDRGEELPDDATDSERRDIAAYVAARDALGVEVKLIEQFVVLDDLEVGGTLDRLIRIDSPSLGRRVTAIGDVKTGRMDFGAGKMARQLAGYAKGKTYDWRDPEHVRKPLRANQQVGYIFNVPAGQGVCFVYELDLTLGARGLKLCKEIFDYRAETSTLKKVGTLIHTTEKEK